MNSIPPLTMKLLWAAVASFLVSMLPWSVLAHLVLWPIGGMGGDIDGGVLGFLGDFMPWQLATHLLVNPGMKMIFVALTLYFFGGMMLEAIWGSRRYGLFLLACAAGSTLLQFIVSSVAFNVGLGGYSPTYGADGVMYGILFACAYLDPQQKVMLILPPIPVRMQTLVIVLCTLNFGVGLWSAGLLSQFGFLGGLLAAWLHIRYWRGQPPFGKNNRKKPPPRFRIVN